MRAGESFVDDQKRKERAEKFKKYPWFKLKVNQSAKVRFLWELSDGIALYRHKRKEHGNVSCFRNEEYGEVECPYCTENMNFLAQGGERKKLPFSSYKEYFWLVYDHNTKLVEILAFKNTSFTPVSSLQFYESQNETLLDRDVIIRRIPAPAEGNPDATKYEALVNAPSKFTVEGEVPTREEILEYLKPFELRDVPAPNSDDDTPEPEDL